MSWGKEWPNGQYGKLNTQPTEWPTDKEWLKYKEVNPFDKSLYEQSWIGIDLGSEPSQTVTAIIKDGQIEKVYNNLSPTHDSYTNPNSHIYYQCKCGDILDPGTKSFAALNNCASEKGWKVRWSKDGQGYEPFCVECGEDVE